jgi:DNA adenine methylase
VSHVALICPLRKGEREGIFTGIVLVPDLPDAHGDVFSRAEIEQTAHQFLKDYVLTKAECSPDVEHSGRSANADLLEHYLAPSDVTIEGKPVRAGSWIQTWKINDPSVKQEVEDGTLTGLSLEGSGHRTPVATV